MPNDLMEPPELKTATPPRPPRKLPAAKAETTDSSDTQPVVPLFVARGVPLLAPGAIVKWLHPGNRGEWLPAVVNRQNADGSALLSVFNGNPTLDVSRRAAVYVNDPEATHERIRMYGAWDLCDEKKEALLLARRVEALEAAAHAAGILK